MNTTGVLLMMILLLWGLATAALDKRQWLRRTGLAVVLIVVGVACYFLRQSHRWDRGFDQIHIGDSRERVRQIMGAPTEDTDATIGIYGSKRLATDQDKSCTEQYWYYPFFTPECWWIALDAQGRVITTFHYVSP